MLVDLTITNEVDYVCSWRQEAPKAKTAMSAVQPFVQMQPWWIQPSLGLYDLDVSRTMQQFVMSAVLASTPALQRAHGLAGAPKQLQPTAYSSELADAGPAALPACFTTS